MKETMAKKIFLIVSTLTVILILNSCGENGVEPLPKPETPPQPGRRDYIWEEYVLETTQNYITLMRSIWGATSNDIWTCGQAYLSKSQVWHFNGITWMECGDLVPDRDQTAVWGSSAKDIWMSSGIGKMFHFDGNEWTEKTQLKVDWFEYVLVDRIWGISANEIYASGYCFQPIPTATEKPYGVVFKYDGKEWKQLKLPVKYTNFFRIRVDKDGILYIAAFRDDTWLGEIYSYNGISFTNLLSINDIPNMDDISGYVYTQKEQKIYRLKSSGLTEWKDLTGTNFNGIILGARSTKDFFAHSKSGIGHYNGTDFVQVYPLSSRANVPDALLFEKDVFFLIADNNINKTRILHGKLKD